MDFNTGCYHCSPPVGHFVVRTLYSNQYDGNWLSPIMIGTQYVGEQHNTPAFYNYNVAPQPGCPVHLGQPLQSTPYLGAHEGGFLVHQYHNPTLYNCTWNPVYYSTVPVPSQPRHQPQQMLLQPFLSDATMEPYDVLPPPLLQPTLAPVVYSPPPQPNPFPFGKINIKVPVYPGKDNLPPKYVTVSVPLADPKTIQPPQQPSPRPSTSARFQSIGSPLEQGMSEGEQAAWEDEQNDGRENQTDEMEEPNRGGLGQSGEVQGQNQNYAGEAAAGAAVEEETDRENTEIDVGGTQPQDNPISVRPGVPGNKNSKAREGGVSRYKFCKFCKSNGEMLMYCYSHNLRDENGKTTCPILRRHICYICGGTGDNGHTVRYCPKRQRMRDGNHMSSDRYFDLRSAVGGYVHVKY